MPDAPSPDHPRSRRTIVRDVLVFQVKLWLEGFKDVVLMPLSLGAAVVDLVFRRKEGQGLLYSVMKLGDRFEQWVHLYAALEPAERKSGAGPHPRDALLDGAADGMKRRSPGASVSERWASNDSEASNGSEASGAGGDS